MKKILSGIIFLLIFYIITSIVFFVVNYIFKLDVSFDRTILYTLVGYITSKRTE